MKSIGFIDYYLDEFHANKYPRWLNETSGGELRVRYAYAKIDSPLQGGMTTDEWCKKYNIERVYSVEELIEKSDCINVLSPDNPEKHEELCELALKSQKRVYVDKTFTDTKDLAVKLFKMAEDSGTPCFSASALRFAVEYRDIDRSKTRGIISTGPGLLSNYSIHQIEPIIFLMGSDIKSVCFTGTQSLPALTIKFKDGRAAHMSLSHHGWDCPFEMKIDFEDGTTENIEIKSDFFGEFIKEMANFFQTGEIKVPHKDTVSVMAVREAAIKAAQIPEAWIEL